MNFIERIEQYKKDGKNLFSYTEKIMAALMDPFVFNDLMPEDFKTDPQAGYYELDQDQREFVDRALIPCQITGETLRLIQELRAKSEGQRDIPKAIHDCVYMCNSYFNEIKAGVLIDAKYPDTK